MSTILLVEDDPSILSLMSAILEPSGHLVLKASAAEQAYLRFDEADASVDLLIADVNLPVTSGIRIAVELRSLLPNLGIVLTSGYTPDMWDQGEVAELNRLASDSVFVLQKPFAVANLVQAVSRFVSIRLPGVALAKAS